MRQSLIVLSSNPAVQGEWGDFGDKGLAEPYWVDQHAMKKLIVILIVILASSLGYGAEKRYSVPIGDSPAAGPADALVTIIEFLDFQ